MVTFNANGGEGEMSNQGFEEGVRQALKTNTFTKSGYTFSGWALEANGEKEYNDGQKIIIDTDLTLYAVWVQEGAATYSITFNSNGGSGLMSNQTFNEDEQKNITANAFSKIGYTFDGWATTENGSKVYDNNQSVTLTSNLTLYAIWTANTYTVSYNGNGSTSGSTANSAHTYGVAKNLTANGFAKTGYTFSGWATSASGSKAYDNSQSITNLTETNGATVTLYAVWTANTYTVSYNGNGNTSGSTASSTHTYGVAKNLTANGFAKTGYTFGGWATSASGSKAYDNSQSVTNLTSTNGGSVTLYAVWNAITYTVAFNSNGGSGTLASITVAYNQSKALPSNTFTKTGAQFKGWSLTSTGTVAYTNGATIKNLATTSKTVTLYAVWEDFANDIKVYILAGQSNAVGCTNTSELDSAYRATNQNVIMYVNGEPAVSGRGNEANCNKWINAQPGYGIHSGCFGPEVGMANVLGQIYGKDTTANNPTPYKVAIIKYAWGATGLADMWLSESGYKKGYASTNASSTTTKHKYVSYNGNMVGYQYSEFMKTVVAATTALTNMGYNISYGGMAWMQGCDDSNDPTGRNANNYEDMLKCLINDVRTHLNTPNLPFTIGEIAVKITPYIETVRAAEYKVGTTYANCSFVDTDDLSIKVDDWWHFDSPSIYQIGRRFGSQLVTATEKITISSYTTVQFKNTVQTKYTLPMFVECTTSTGAKLPMQATWASYSPATTTGTTTVNGTVKSGTGTKAVSASVITGTNPVVDGLIDQNGDKIWSTLNSKDLAYYATDHWEVAGNVWAYLGTDGLYLGALIYDDDIMSAWEDTTGWYRYVEDDQVLFHMLGLMLLNIL